MNQDLWTPSEGIQLSGVDRKESDALSVHLEIASNTVYCDGHFRGDRILPGVVQTTVIAERIIARYWLHLSRPKAVRRLKFMHAIRPPEELSVEFRRSKDTVRFEFHAQGKRKTLGTLVY